MTAVTTGPGSDDWEIAEADRSLQARLHRLEDGVIRVVGPVRLPLAAIGFVLAVLGPNLAWASFTGFPGLMTLTFYPAATKMYCLVLACAFPLVVLRWGGRRQAGIIAMLGLLAVSVQTTVAISNAGGGLVNVSIGAWVTIAGAVCGVLAMLSLERDDSPPADWNLPNWAELVVVALSAGTGLGVIVYALDVNDGDQFVSLMIALAAAGLVLSKLGVIKNATEVNRAHNAVSLTLIGLAAVAFPFTQNGDAYWLRVAASVLIFASAAIGLNVVVGLAGLLDLGYVAFFGVGAYVAAMFSNATFAPEHHPGHLPFILVIGIGALVAGLVGVLIGAPTLRLRGDYLAIVTLGFGEIFQITVNNTDSFTGGPNGFAGIPQPALGGLDFGDSHRLFGVPLPYFANYYWGELILLAVLAFLFLRMGESRIGRAWVAIREDELAASAMGINTTALKLLAFGIGATLSGAAGTVNAHLSQQVSPDSYTFQQSVTLLAIVVLGGMGTVSGAILGATLLVVLPEKLRAFSDYRLLLFGLALILIMRFRPEGFIPNRRRKREFRDAEAVVAEGDSLAPDALNSPPGGR
jgi:branched-chain amino acid transport system permease protein